MVIRARTAAGLFAGVQTLRQLLPATVEAKRRQSGPWLVPAARIVDQPRFAYRGAMLDVARHFFSVREVKRYIDEIAQYKVNRLHLHLADDQGWRIQIAGWPRLTSYGGSTEVGGGPGGYYTQREYAELVAYAKARYITVIPEIDMPGHTNAALASYAELNCDGIAPPLYTGTEVGFSSLCVDKEITYRFLDDVIRQLAAITPGEYLHIGGDEAHATTEPDYLKFMARVLPIVAKYGKKVAGWHEFVKSAPAASALPQFWGTDDTEPIVVAAAARGNKVLMSPANKAYLDMKYDENTPLGQDWAALIEVADAYGWDPGNYLQGLPETLGARRRGTALVGDPGGHPGHRVHGVPAAAGAGRARLVTVVDARLGLVPHPARRPGTALDRPGHQLLPLTPDRLAELSPSASISAPPTSALWATSSVL